MALQNYYVLVSMPSFYFGSPNLNSWYERLMFLLDFRGFPQFSYTSAGVFLVICRDHICLHICIYYTT